MGSWQGSTRRRRLPKDWPETTLRIKERDGWRCTVAENGERCHGYADEVDHIQRGDDHRDTNLAAICTWHHRKKSGREGGSASRRRLPSARRKPEAHPGLIP